MCSVRLQVGAFRPTEDVRLAISRYFNVDPRIEETRKPQYVTVVNTQLLSPSVALRSWAIGNVYVTWVGHRDQKRNELSTFMIDETLADEEAFM
jgi:hypothetical protein